MKMVLFSFLLGCCSLLVSAQQPVDYVNPFIGTSNYGTTNPGQVELLTSEDGENFISRGIVPTTVPADDPDLLFQEYTFDGNWKTRYIRLKAPRANPGFIFADEIVVW